MNVHTIPELVEMVESGEIDIPKVCNNNTADRVHGVYDGWCSDISEDNLFSYVCTYVWEWNGTDVVGKWKWLLLESPNETLEDGNPLQECFDGVDDDCDGKIDSEEEACEGRCMDSPSLSGL